MSLSKTLLDPTWTDPKQLEPQYGVGRVTLDIWFKSILLNEDIPVQKHLDYSWQQTVNGIEVFVQNPHVKRASDQDYDIIEAIEKDLGFRIDHLNYIEHERI